MSESLLDTSVLIEVEERLGDLPEAAAISVITLGELRAGVLLARTEAELRVRQERFAAVRAAFIPLPVDVPVADQYGRMLATARTARRTARASDLLIIATATATGRRLYTLDPQQARLADAGGVEVIAL